MKKKIVLISILILTATGLWAGISYDKSGTYFSAGPYWGCDAYLSDSPIEMHMSPGGHFDFMWRSSRGFSLLTSVGMYARLPLPAEASDPVEWTMSCDIVPMYSADVSERALVSIGLGNRIMSSGKDSDELESSLLGVLRGDFFITDSLTFTMKGEIYYAPGTIDFNAATAGEIWSPIHRLGGGTMLALSWVI